MDIKQVLSEKLRFTAKDEKKRNWFKSKFFIGLDKAIKRMVVTEKGKQFRKEGKFALLYKGQIPETEEELGKLLKWLGLVEEQKTTQENENREQQGKD